jgi:hypothetical protein
MCRYIGETLPDYSEFFKFIRPLVQYTMDAEQRMTVLNETVDFYSQYSQSAPKIIRLFTFSAALLASVKH